MNEEEWVKGYQAAIKDWETLFKSRVTQLFEDLRTDAATIKRAADNKKQRAKLRTKPKLNLPEEP